MQPIAFAALAVITVCTVQLYILGRRFIRRYVLIHRAMPRMTWMFHRVDDGEMERARRLALGILPVYLIALVVYLFRP